MSEKKIRASILGKDINLLKNVAKRVVKDRPADVKYFTEVKEFLVDAASDRPDVVAISVNYPHPSASKFPKIFSMVLNLPVIMFGEDQDVKTRKDLSAANADYKIPGVLTAHNFWMKLVNFQKMQEKEIELREKEINALANASLDESDNSGSSHKDKQALAQKVFAQLLENGDEDSDSSLIDSLFSQMGEDDQNGESRKSESINIIKSSNNGPKNSNSLLHWEEEDSVASIKSEKKTKNFTMIKGENNSDHVNTSDSDETSSSNVIIQHKDSNVMSINPQDDINKSESSLENKKNKNSVDLQELEEDLKESQEENRRANLKPVSKGSATNNLSGHANALKSSDEENPFGEVTRKEEDVNVDANMTKNDFFSDEAPQASIEDMLSGLDDDINPEVEDESQEDLDSENEQKLQNQELVKKPKTDSKGRVQLTDKKELQKREFEKQKEKQKKDNERTQNILEECCDEAVKKVFIAKTLTNPRSFESQKVFVYTIEVDSFKGFILVNNSFNQDFEEFMLENLRSVIIENLKSKGYSADLSVAYSIAIPESQYIEVVNDCCEFTVSNEEETGKQLFVSFLKREVISPRYEDSDKDGMIVVDMKTIPPQTPVNFDAFIYMPINKKFVRYLKEGRSLSLKQVKRHIEGDEACELYLPKSDKAKLIQFFIQNTISWEFISYNEEHKKPA